jgi:hypothetical protein
VRGDAQLQDHPSAQVQRCGTLNSLATGRLVDVVGSVDSQGKPAPYSSAQDTGGPAKKPQAHHVMAITDGSRAQLGILAAGTHSGSVVALRGTSMAAPQLTRALAQGYLQGKKWVAPHEKTPGRSQVFSSPSGGSDAQRQDWGLASHTVTDHDGQKRSQLAMTGETQERAQRRRGA